MFRPLIYTLLTVFLIPTAKSQSPTEAQLLERIERLEQALLLLHAKKDLKDLELSGNTKLKGKVEFLDKDATTHNTDRIYLEKIDHQSDQSDLRLTVNDNGNERLEVWGSACSNGGCSGKGRGQHFLQGDGTAYHRNKLIIAPNIAPDESSQRIALEDGSLSSNPAKLIAVAKNDASIYLKTENAGKASYLQLAAGQNRWDISHWGWGNDLHFINRSDTNPSQVNSRFTLGNNGDITIRTSENMSSGHKIVSNGRLNLSISGAYNAVKHNNESSSGNSIKMTSKNNSMCFLTQVDLEDLDSQSEIAGCRIYVNGNHWYLRAKSSSDSDAWCEARCISW